LSPAKPRSNIKERSPAHLVEQYATDTKLDRTAVTDRIKQTLLVGPEQAPSAMHSVKDHAAYSDKLELCIGHSRCGHL
jgi:hypothetical protein